MCPNPLLGTGVAASVRTGVVGESLVRAPERAPRTATPIARKFGYSQFSYHTRRCRTTGKYLAFEVNPLSTRPAFGERGPYEDPGDDLPQRGASLPDGAHAGGSAERGPRGAPRGTRTLRAGLGDDRVAGHRRRLRPGAGPAHRSGPGRHDRRP